MNDRCACGVSAGITHVCPVVRRCWCGCQRAREAERDSDEAQSTAEILHV